MLNWRDKAESWRHSRPTEKEKKECSVLTDLTKQLSGAKRFQSRQQHDQHASC